MTALLQNCNLSIAFLKFSMYVCVSVLLKYNKWGCVKCYKKVKLFFYLIRHLDMKKIGTESIALLFQFIHSFFYLYSIDHTDVEIVIRYNYKLLS